MILEAKKVILIIFSFLIGCDSGTKSKDQIYPDPPPLNRKDYGKIANVLIDDTNSSSDNHKDYLWIGINKKEVYDSLKVLRNSGKLNWIGGQIYSDLDNVNGFGFYFNPDSIIVANDFASNSRTTIDKLKNQIIVSGVVYVLPASIVTIDEH